MPVLAAAISVLVSSSRTIPFDAQHSVSGSAFPKVLWRRKRQE
jgi:hypothetical protein